MIFLTCKLHHSTPNRATHQLTISPSRTPRSNPSTLTRKPMQQIVRPPPSKLKTKSLNEPQTCTTTTICMHDSHDTPLPWYTCQHSKKNRSDLGSGSGPVPPGCAKSVVGLGGLHSLARQHNVDGFQSKQR
jgi:hypothetical protein